MLCLVMGIPDLTAEHGARTVRILTVADLHQRESLYTELQHSVRTHRPDALILCGDFLHAMKPESGMLSVSQCAQAIARLEVPQILAVRGNHEHLQFADFAEAMASSFASFTTLHGEAAQVGCMTLLGFECVLGNDAAFTLWKEPLPPEPGAWVPTLLRKLGTAGRCLWVAHEPPACTPLTATTGPLSGNPEWTELIERFSPRVVVCGHDHDTPIRRKQWHCRVGDSFVLNFGQTNGERLHYGVVDAEFSSSITALPSRITIRAFPWEQELVIGPAGAPLRPAPFPESDR
jgi:Icc-related predicted phosphoesterase